MPVSQLEADTMLAEFIAMRGITKVKRGAKGPKVRITPDPLERVEYEPDNRFIERQSRGIQTKHIATVAQLLQRGFLNAAAHVMVMEHLNPSDYRFTYPLVVTVKV